MSLGAEPVLLEVLRREAVRGGLTAVVLWLVALGGVLSGCGSERELPETVLAGRSAALVDLLDACSSTVDSPVSRKCAELSEAVRPCRAVVSICSVEPGEGGEACGLMDNLRCAEPEDLEMAGLGDSDHWLLRGPLLRDDARGSFELRGHLEDDGVHRIVARFAGASGEDGWHRWLPSGQAPGKFALSGIDSFLHARWRPVAGILPKGERPETLADRLYGLRAKLFSAAVLTGNVELVLFTPSEGSLLPGSALALDFHLRRPAVAAMEEYIEDLQQQWPLSRSDYQAGAWTGACLGNLNVMPELAPCYVATEGAIVVGWNRASLEAALGLPTSVEGKGALFGSGQAVPENLGERSRVQVDFKQLALADRRLADARQRGLAFDYPFAYLDILGGRDGDTFVMELALRPGEGR